MDGHPPGGTPMPEISGKPAEAEAQVLHPGAKRSARARSSKPEEAGRTPPAPLEEGAFFRTLLQAGCSAQDAYTAAQEAKRMAGENVVGQVSAQLTDLSRLLSEGLNSLSERLDRLDERLDRQADKLDQHAEILAEHGTRLEVLAVRMDGLKTEMRLMWGALGALITVLALVFTLLFSR